MQSDIFDNIIDFGSEASRLQAKNKTERRLVDMRAQILGDEDNVLSLTYSGFCLVALPHRALPVGDKWERHGHRISLVVQPGVMRVGRQTIDLGVPYGSRARMILLYLQTRALQTGERIVELGRSMNDWLSRMGLSIGGKTYAAIRDQSNRISACRLSFYWDDEQGAKGFYQDSIVRRGVQFQNLSSDPNQPPLFREEVELSESFFDALKAHPVPLQETAVRELSNRSMSLDLYFWLAYRLHTLRSAIFVPFNALFEQFGAGFHAEKKFRQSFKEALKFALAVYPDAKVSIEAAGVRLYPSRPPVEFKGSRSRHLIG